MNKQTNTPSTPSTIKGTKVTYQGQDYKSIAALCKAVGVEPYSKDYRRIKKRILDLGWDVSRALEHVDSTQVNVGVETQVKSIRVPSNLVETLKSKYPTQTFTQIALMALTSASLEV